VEGYAKPEEGWWDKQVEGYGMRIKPVCWYMESSKWYAAYGIQQGMLPMESSKTHVRGRHTIQKSETEIGMAIAMLLTVCAISQTGNV